MAGKCGTKATNDRGDVNFRLDWGWVVVLFGEENGPTVNHVTSCLPSFLFVFSFLGTKLSEA